MRCCAVFVLIMAGGQTAAAGLIASSPDVFTGTPVGSWSYSEQLAYGQGNSTTYYPTTLAELSGVSFQAYVTYDPAFSPGGSWLGNPVDSLQVFETDVKSPVDQVVPLFFNHDDGGSLFIDDAFIGGGGFNVPVSHALTLTALVPKRITLALFNGQGNWYAHVGIGHDRFNLERIEGFNGIEVDASGKFIAVPEPCCWAVSAAFMCLLAALHRRRPIARRNRKQMT